MVNSPRSISRSFVSIHAPLTGRDRCKASSPSRSRRFQSTRPSRGAMSRIWVGRTPRWFQSTRPSRGAMLGPGHVDQRCRVSIHAPLTGRDTASRFSSRRSAGFNPRAPHGARSRPAERRGATRRFQSTRPSRGAMLGASICNFRCARFNPRAPHGARCRPRPSGRPVHGVSIHAPLTGRDNLWSSHPSARHGFNPRAPHGARSERPMLDARPHQFQSTRPSRGAIPRPAPTDRSAPAVSIHAPLTGRDLSRSRRTIQPRRFQSTRPSRGAIDIEDGAFFVLAVSIHAPLTGRDRRWTAEDDAQLVFQSTRPSRGAISASAN